jgi:hypothetical protein
MLEAPFIVARRMLRMGDFGLRKGNAAKTADASLDGGYRHRDCYLEVEGALEDALSLRVPA